MTIDGRALLVEADRATLATYVPRLLTSERFDEETARLITVEGTLVSADISGFTALSERLAQLGNEGAEELTDLLNRCFTQMIGACESTDGDVIKFGGDALLILFKGTDHARRAAVTMARMRAIVAQDWSTNSVARVDLGISQGAHSGVFEFSLVDGGHMELFAGGPSVSMTVTCEGDAGRGVILVSRATAALLPPTWTTGGDSGETAILRHRIIDAEVDLVDVIDLTESAPTGSLDRYLPPALIDQVLVAGSGEHRQVAIAFISISGTDDLHRNEGAEAVHAAYEQIAENIRSVLAHHEVHWLASDAYVNGAKVILTAGAPVSTDADEDHLLLAVHELLEHDSPLPLRAGVNRGHVFVGDLGAPTRKTFTIMGDAVNLAARLMQKADKGQVVASAEVLGRASTPFSVEPLEPFFVKGKSNAIEASVLVGVGSEDIEPAHVTEVPFVGRTEEVEFVGEMARSAAEGRGAFLELRGDAGIGKTRLVQEVLRQNPDLSPTVLRGGQYGRNTPYFVIRRFLHGVIGLDEGQDAVEHGRVLHEWVLANAPALAPWTPLLALAVGADVAPTAEVDRLADQFRRERLLDVVADAADAALSGPVAIIAEDSHLFDDASLEVLRRLGKRAPHRPWLMIATHRSDADRLLDSSRVLELEPLDDADTADLAAAAAQLIESVGLSHQLQDLANRSGGHPLFVLELVAAASAGGGDELPESIESLVTSRIDLLSPSDRLLLREAAVGGAVVNTALLAEAMDNPGLIDDRRWTGLTDFLKRESRGMFRFRHAMHRDVAYSGLSYRRRREVHLRIGNSLERGSGVEVGELAPLLSLHFDRAREVARAWRYSLIAGDDARTSHATAEAIVLYRRALENASRLVEVPPAKVSGVAESLGDVLTLAGRYDESFDAYQMSRRAVGGDPEVSVRLFRKLGQTRQRQGNFPQSLRWLTVSLNMVDEVQSEVVRSSEEAEISRARSGTLHLQGKNGASVRWAERAVNIADEGGDRLARAKAYNMLEIAYRTLGRPEAKVYADRALEMYRGTGDLVGEADVLNNVGVRAHFEGDWVLAKSSYERCHELRWQSGDIAGGAMARTNLGEILLLQGHYDQAREHFAAALATFRDVESPLGAAYVSTNMAMVEARSGEPETGRRMLSEAEETLGALGAVGLALEAAVRRVECHLLAGDPDLALLEAGSLNDRLAEHQLGDDQLAAQLAPLSAVALAMRGRTDEASAALDHALKLARSNANPCIEAAVLLCQEALSGSDESAEGTAARLIMDRLEMVQTPPIVALV